MLDGLEPLMIFAHQHIAREDDSVLGKCNGYSVEPLRTTRTYDAAVHSVVRHHCELGARALPERVFAIGYDQKQTLIFMDAFTGSGPSYKAQKFLFQDHQWYKHDNRDLIVLVRWGRLILPHQRGTETAARGLYPVCSFPRHSFGDRAPTCFMFWHFL